MPCRLRGSISTSFTSLKTTGNRHLRRYRTRHIGIHDNIYDFVIIDEAARSYPANWRLQCNRRNAFFWSATICNCPPCIPTLTSRSARRLGINDKHTELDEALLKRFLRGLQFGMPRR